ncbi:MULTISPECIES: hypothetical protein [Nostoc]|nr:MULTISPECIES: hypothetical protein [Nostoc]MBD2682744.1 hypothetical protein [Nostoc sp. FACHB-857]
MLSENGGWTALQTEVAIAHYKMFLCLHFLFPSMELIPTKEVDAVWHTHILLDTYQYIQDCHDLYGYILHHRSSLGNSNESECHQDIGFLLTQALFDKLFESGIWKNINSQIAPYESLPMCSNPSIEKSACLILPKKQLLTIN